MKRRSGFTIIEVMIVLAIAGMILAIVFIAVPQLQLNNRDNQRRNMAARIKGELEQFASINQGQYPFVLVGSSWADCFTITITTPQSCYDWYNRYIMNYINITDPLTGGPTKIKLSNLTTNPTASDWGNGGNWGPGIYIGVGDKCSGGSIAAGTTTGTQYSKKYAVLIALERQNTWFCIDNG